MDWILIAVFGYFLLAIEAVVSKGLLTGRIKNWQSYAVYVGLLSSIGFLVALGGIWNDDWQVLWTDFGTFFIAFLSGFIFFISLLFLYRSLQFSAASRVYVLYGAVITTSSFIIGNFLIDEQHTIEDLLGIIFLMIGGLMISYKFYKNKFFSTSKFVVIAGILASFSLIFLKYTYDQQNFTSGYVYSRLGMFLSAILFLIIPFPEKNINSSEKKSKKNKKEWRLDALAILSAKTIAGVGTFLIYYAISLGSVTIVNAMVSIQYLFTFLLVIILGFYFHSLKENLTLKNILFKTLGVLIVISGIFLISI